MNHLIQKIQAEIKSVEAQRDTATHSGDHQDADDYSNIINGMKRILKLVEEAAK